MSACVVLTLSAESGTGHARKEGGQKTGIGAIPDAKSAH